MKFFNKRKATRSGWTAVKAPKDYLIAKAWCQRHPSPGKFYFRSRDFHDFNDFYRLGVRHYYWLFENSEDALAFSLMWST